MDALGDLQARIRDALGERPVTGTAVRAGLPRNAIRNVLDGHEPTAGRLAAICDALGLEFYVGPPRGTDPAPLLRAMEARAQALTRVVVDAGGDPVPEDLRPVLAERWGMGTTSDLANASALAVGAVNEDALPPGARPVDVVELAAVAGGEVVGCVWFRQDWLEGRGLDPSQCAVVRVSGESMEPVLPDGCSILVDRERRRRVEGRIFVVRTGDGLIVKRAGRNADGKWRLLSEHPSWAPAPWPADAETIGEAVWTARSLV